jgi:hypothetical protein
MEYAHVCARGPGFTGQNVHTIAQQCGPYKLDTGSVAEDRNKASAHIDIGHVDPLAEKSHRGQDRARLHGNVLAATSRSGGRKAISQVRRIERQFVKLLTLGARCRCPINLQRQRDVSACLLRWRSRFEAELDESLTLQSVEQTDNAPELRVIRRGVRRELRGRRRVGNPIASRRLRAERQTTATANR